MIETALLVGWWIFFLNMLGLVGLYLFVRLVVFFRDRL